MAHELKGGPSPARPIHEALEPCGILEDPEGQEGQTPDHGSGLHRNILCSLPVWAYHMCLCRCATSPLDKGSRPPKGKVWRGRSGRLPVHTRLAGDGEGTGSPVGSGRLPATAGGLLTACGVGVTRPERATPDPVILDLCFFVPGQIRLGCHSIPPDLSISEYDLLDNPRWIRSCT